MPSVRRALVGLALALAVGATSGCAQRADDPTTEPPPAMRSAAPSPTPSPTPDVTPSPVPTGALADRPFTVVAVGDSLSTGFDACSFYGDCPEVSWSTGSDDRVQSVAERLQAATGDPVTTVNVARAGAVVADLPAQVTAAIAAQPTIVTVLIGGNDVCRASVSAMTPAEDYAAVVDEQLRRITEAVPDAVVLAASTPDVTALLDAAAGDETARFLWSNMGGCATALEDPLSETPDDLDRREAVRERIRDYNAALEAACTRVQRCVYDGGALHDYRPTFGQLSALDAFHPSVAGLRELAATEWDALTAGLGDLEGE